MTAPPAGLPGLEGLTDILSGLTGKTAYVIPLTDELNRPVGNNGDQLMHRVFARVLELLDVRIVAQPSDSEAFILPPSGSLLERYSFPSILRRRLAALPDLPLTIFPSSGLFPTLDPAGLFGSRRSRTTWILRERTSYSQLRKLWGGTLAEARVDLHLDHDIVASGHQFVPSLIGGSPTEETVLIAARNDREATAALDKGAPTPGPRRAVEASVARRLPYGRAFTLAGRMARRHSQRELGERLVGLLPEAAASALPPEAPRVFNDISATQFATYEEYCAALTHARVVVTNRLHVGLPACILGKQVFLVESAYGKLRGVHQQSLQGVANITLVDGRSGA